MNEIRINLDGDVLVELERRAKEHGRTAADEAEEIIRGHVDRERLRRDPVAWARHIQAMTPKNVPQTDSLVLLPKDRDR